LIVCNAPGPDGLAIFPLVNTGGWAGGEGYGALGLGEADVEVDAGFGGGLVGDGFRLGGGVGWMGAGVEEGRLVAAPAASLRRYHPCEQRTLARGPVLRQNGIHSSA
jgi:hypothetical protein